MLPSKEEVRLLNSYSILESFGDPTRKKTMSPLLPATRTANSASSGVLALQLRHA